MRPVKWLRRPRRLLAWLVQKARISYRRLLFQQEFAAFRWMSARTQPRLPLRWAERQPCLHDKTPITGFDHHYIYHTAWAARVLARTRPTVHIDIASSLYFCSSVSAFVPVQFYDYRPAHLHLDNLVPGSADLLALPIASGSVVSLSCMHVVEHIGLGRYGDPLDPDGDLKAMAELKRVLAPEGSLLFVVPLGRPRICFNAHRIYSYDQVRAYFADLCLVEFALIPDAPQAASSGLIYGASRELANTQEYGCGCFWLKRSTV